ncbi:glycosyltransferase [Lentzea sp. NPDC055074]
MRFLLSTIGSRGEVQPVTALALRLKELGDDVEVVSPPDFEQLVTGHGITFTPFGPSLRGGPADQDHPGRPAQAACEEQALFRRAAIVHHGRAVTPETLAYQAEKLSAQVRTDGATNAAERLTAL